MSGGSGEIVGPLGRTGGEGRGSLRIPGGVLILRLLIAAAIAALCLGSIASCAAAAPVLGENNTPGVPPAPGNTTGGEKPVTAKLPGTPDEPSEPAETSVTARPADIAATLEETPPPDIINATHILGAMYGMERLMGRDHSPVRKVLDYAAEHLIQSIPLNYILTVTDAPGGVVATPHAVRLRAATNRSVTLRVIGPPWTQNPWGRRHIRSLPDFIPICYSRAPIFRSTR